MANTHVLTATGNTITLVLHIAIPATNNPRGVAWRTALVRSGIGGKTILPDGDGTGGTISALEKADVSSGAVYELVTSPKRMTSTNAALDEFYAKLSAETLAGLQTMLANYGHTR